MPDKVTVGSTSTGHARRRSATHSASTDTLNSRASAPVVTVMVAGPSAPAASATVAGGTNPTSVPSGSTSRTPPSNGRAVTPSGNDSAYRKVEPASGPANTRVSFRPLVRTCQRASTPVSTERYSASGPASDGVTGRDPRSRNPAVPPSMVTVNSPSARPGSDASNGPAAFLKPSPSATRVGSIFAHSPVSSRKLTGAAATSVRNDPSGNATVSENSVVRSGTSTTSPEGGAGDPTGNGLGSAVCAGADADTSGVADTAATETANTTTSAVAARATEEPAEPT